MTTRVTRLTITTTVDRHSNDDKKGNGRNDNEDDADDGDSHSAKNGIDEVENDSAINENDGGMLLEPITRAPGQRSPRRTSVFPREK